MTEKIRPLDEILSRLTSESDFDSRFNRESDRRIVVGVNDIWRFMQINVGKGRPFNIEPDVAPLLPLYR